MKISTKITVTCLAIVLLSTAVFLGTVLIQRERLAPQLESLVQDQARHETGKIVQTIYYNCISSEARNTAQLAHDLLIAREVLKNTGANSFDTNTVAWTAVNQITAEAKSIQLPRWRVGGTWLGQNTSPDKISPIVDEVRHLTGGHCTIFQRMNEDGDMLRVDTTIVKTDGARAVGTYISHQNADGSANAVIATVLKGETFHGRAFVVNEYHCAAYEPIWDRAGKRVVGMLYVGVPLAAIDAELHDAITKIIVGKTGYAYVLDSKGNYIVSQNGKRDKECIWDAKDADGRLIIQSIVAKAHQTSDGSLTNETYTWKNPGENVARRKFAEFTYYAHWDWIIVAGAYEDDYQAVNAEVNQSMNNLVKWTSLASLCVGLAGLVASYFLSLGIARPVIEIAGQLEEGANQTVSSAGQVSSASQSLAEGASEQAASLEQTGASLEEMTSMIKRNTENSQKTTELAKEARVAADEGVGNMQAMATAMDAIKVSSDDIAKIIKTIDEIAFQTNILALNAAVEAARAGEAGMGFAVVADEVRNLAQRSAEAAKETAAKIEGAIAKTGQGVLISGKVKQALTNIAAKIHQVDELAAEVATASSEQARGIGQISIAITEMDKITQANAANSEESAASAEELNSQAEIMQKSVVDLLKLVGGKSGGNSSPEPEVTIAPQIHKPAEKTISIPSRNRPIVSAQPQTRTAALATRRNRAGLIAWDEASMATGVSTVDSQHQTLIQRINELHTACLAGTAKEELLKMLAFLGEYAVSHFKHEEGVMDQHQCPVRGKNKGAHIKFLKDYGELVELVKREGASTTAVIKLKEMLADWLTNHICSVDTHLRGCAQVHNN